MQSSTHLPHNAVYTACRGLKSAPVIRPSFTDALAVHYPDAVRFSRMLCARWSADEAEDVLQQSLVKALENYEQLRDPAKFRSWLFRIITQCFHGQARRHFWKRFVPIAEVNDQSFPSVFRERPLSAETRELLDVLARLPQRDRAALLLFELAGFSLEELAEIQGDRSISATKSRLSRARAKARALLEAPPVGTRHSGGHDNSIEQATLRLLDEIDREVDR